MPLPTSSTKHFSRISPSAFVGSLRRPRLNSRLFTQDSRRLLISPTKVRPELPYLHATTRRWPTQYNNQNQFPSQVARLLTTERKQFIKDQLKLGVRFTVIGWAVIGLASAITFGIQLAISDRRYPSPSEWTFKSKYIYVSAKSNEEPNEHTGLVDWSRVGELYRQLIERLEDPSIDGQGIQAGLNDEGHLYVEGLGKAGLDISAKSEPWRRGYFQSLMGIARAAENREGWVTDTTQAMVFPPHLVLGPSNPNPRPMPPGAPPAPLEENCVPNFEGPTTYYIKILTTQGFASRQRLDAALAYADWLDFKGLSSTAEDMYDWALDIVKGSSHLGCNDAVDVKTGVINTEAQKVSSNLLLVTTALASHHARNNNLATALPIFLSILRARRQLPEPASTNTSPKQRNSFLSDMVSFIMSVLAPRPYPPPPPTGDEIPTRTRAEVCEEAGIMANIGEILFASSASQPSGKGSTNAPVGNTIWTGAATGSLETRQSGLSWTRDAVDLAESTLVAAKGDDEETRNKCTDCLAIGMQNWSTMVQQMSQDEQKEKASPKKQNHSNWFWGSGTTTNEGTWETESRVVEERLRTVRRLLLKEEQKKQEKGFAVTLLGR
ncbi:MAG: hypothetical protein Q9163_002201 [Psora crenata]